MDRFQVTSRLTEFWIDAGKTATVTNIGSTIVYGSPDAPPTSTTTAAWSLAPGASRVEDVGAVWVLTANGTSSTLTVEPIASGLATDTGTGVPSAIGSGSGGSGTGITAWAALTAFTAGQVIRNGTLLYLVNTNFTSGPTFDTTNLSQIGTTAGVVSSVNSAFLPVGNQNGFLRDVGQSNGTDTDSNLRTKHKAVRGVAGPRIVYGNFHASQVDPITISAGLELPSGTVKQVTWNGGATSVVIPANSFIISDPIACYVPAATTFWMRSRVVVASTKKWANSYTIVSGIPGEGVETGTGTTDKTLSGTITSSGNGSGVAPICVIAQAAAAKPLIIGYGDSIETGVGDGYIGLNGAELVTGFIHRAAAAAGFPYIHSGKSGENVSDAANTATPTNATSVRRMFSVYAGVVYCEHGVNDIGSGRTALQIETDMVTSWTINGAGGARVIQSTITPSASTTAGWGTDATQTANYPLIRVPINQWLRAGAPISSTTLLPVAIGTSGAMLAGQAGHPLYGVDDVAAAVESSQDSGKWLGTSGFLTCTNGSGTITVVSGAAGLTTGMRLYCASGGGLTDAMVKTIGAGTFTISAPYGNAVVATGTLTNVAFEASMTGDGLHPSPGGHAAASAAINTARWTS